ncbi:MAG: hypothetical protein F6K16_13255 [Symploca sp. SIO2B6]|nr:hypothetical protein [Symploca sp. SIO2B6]
MNVAKIRLSLTKLSGTVGGRWGDGEMGGGGDGGRGRWGKTDRVTPNCQLLYINCSVSIYCEP